MNFNPAIVQGFFIIFSLMETRYFTSGKGNVFIKEESGLIVQIVYFMDGMHINTINFQDDKRCKRRENPEQFEIHKEEYEFWMDIANRINEFRSKSL